MAAAPITCDRSVSFVVRAVHDDRPIVAPAREAIAALDKDLPINARTMRDVYAWFERDRGGQGLVLGALGMVALLLAALGVYAVMSLLVSQQRQEFAIRIALGCSAEALQRLVLARGLRVASTGVVGGLVVGSLLTLMLSRIFFGVQPFDLMKIRNQRQRRRNVEGFANPHQRARREQLLVGGDMSSRPRDQRPYEQAAGDDVPAAVPVGEISTNRTETCVHPLEEREDRAPAGLASDIGDVAHHRELHRREHLTIEVIQERDGNEERDDDPGVPLFRARRKRQARHSVADLVHGRQWG